jgi:hypothetical protein
VRCGCGGGTYLIAPPRAGTVYTGHSVVVINPPTPEDAGDFSTPAARTTALDWVLDGMVERDPRERTRTVQALVDQFLRMNVPRAQAEEMAAAAAAASGGMVSTGGPAIDLPDTARAFAEDGALKLTFATIQGRTTFDDLRDRGEAVLRERYGNRYPESIAAGGLSSVDFLQKFPIITAFFGFSRGEGARGGTTPKLNWFRDNGRLRLYGLKAETEALQFVLDPVAVAEWLRRRGLLPVAPQTPRAARVAILGAADIPAPGEHVVGPTVGTELLNLVHSYAHRVMRSITAFCGIERDALAEYLVPEHLTFLVYANVRGDFVLGGLQALYENELGRAMHEIVYGERRCALDPGCREAGSACMACMHVGEPSCRYFNRMLTRDVLFGPQGYLAQITALFAPT